MAGTVLSLLPQRSPSHADSSRELPDYLTGALAQGAFVVTFSAGEPADTLAESSKATTV